MKMLQEYWASTVIFIGIFPQCIHCEFLGLYPYGRSTQLFPRAAEFYGEKVYIKEFTHRPCLKKSYDLGASRISIARF